MHRSEDRGLLGRSSADSEAPTTLTRRERRRRAADPALATTPEPQSAPPATTRYDTGGLSLAALFARSAEDLADDHATVLFVCTGNICRSPFAEAVLASRLADLDIRVRSAGTRAMVGESMTPPAQDQAIRHGVRAERAASHQGELLTEAILHDADLVLTMTAEHSSQVLQLAPQRLSRTFTVREFARLAEAVSDEALRDSAADATGDRARLAAAVGLIAEQRGLSRPPAGGEDVADPYGKAVAAYDRASAEILPGLEHGERAIRAALRRPLP